MTIPKSLMVAALLVSGATLAMAQSGPATGGEPPVAGGAAGNPAFVPASPGPGFNPEPRLQSAPRANQPRKVYMSARGTHRALKDNSRLAPNSKQ
jgi:hypothetical protein